MRNRLLIAKEKLSRAFLAPPPPESPQSRVLETMRAASLRLMELGPSMSVDIDPQVNLHDTLRRAPPVVHAVGIGRKIRGSERRKEMAVRVYVTRKAEMHALPESEKIPASLEGVPTDVIEAPPARFLGILSTGSCTQTRTKSMRPLIGGVSTSHLAGDTGTIGYFCRSTIQGDSASDVFILCNAHIYANYGAAQLGDHLIQAGCVDGGAAANRIAGFHRAVPLVFGGGPNNIDAAIGKLDAQISYIAEICSIGRVNGTTQAAEDDHVAKHGRTTGYTEGIVDDELIDFIMLPDNSTSYVQFKDQMRIIPDKPAYAVMARNGDSGSLVVKREGHEAVGLLHSAAIDGSYTYASHIDKVLDQLNIALL